MSYTRLIPLLRAEYSTSRFEPQDCVTQVRARLSDAHACALWARDIGTMKIRSHFSSSRQREDTGQAMVEFALVVFFIFSLFLIMLQFIQIMHGYNTLANAAKEGVRYAIVHGTGFCGASASCACSGPGTSGPPAVSCTNS